MPSGPIPFRPLGGGISVKPIQPGMGSVNLGDRERLVQVQFKPKKIDIVTHLGPYHDVLSFDYKGRLKK